MRVPAVLLLAVASFSARAQRAELSLEGGAASTRYADTINAASFSMTPSFRILRPRSALNGTGTFSRFSGASTASGVLDGSIESRSFGLLMLELKGLAGGSAHGDGARTGKMLGSGLVHLRYAAAGAWVGSGVGSTWDGTWRSLRQDDAGAWIGTPQANAMLGVTPTTVDDTIRYTDVVLTARRSFTAVDVDANFGMRRGSQVPTLAASRKSWGGAALTWRLKSGVALVTGVGTYPVDLTQGFPGGRYLSLGLRVIRSTGASPPVLRRVTAKPNAHLRDFRVARVAGGLHELRFLSPTATSIEVSGDVTAWNPVTLTRASSGLWTLRLAIEPGAHELAVRVNGGAWMAPPGLVALQDEFGGESGLLTVTK